MSILVHDIIRYYFPAFAEGLESYFGRPIRVAVWAAYASDEVREHVYDPHGLLRDRYDVRAGQLKRADDGGQNPWNPQGRVRVCRTQVSMANLQDIAVYVEVPHWCSNDAPITAWAARFLEYAVGSTTVERYTTLLGYASYAVQNTARELLDNAEGDVASERLSVTGPYLRRVCGVAGRAEEGKLPRGRILCGGHEDMTANATLLLQPGVSLRQTKQLRKTIQMLSENQALACTSSLAVGFVPIERVHTQACVDLTFSGSGSASISVRTAPQAPLTPVAFFRQGEFSGVPLQPDAPTIARDLVHFSHDIGQTLTLDVAYGIATLACRTTTQGFGAMIVVGAPQPNLRDQGQALHPGLNVTTPGHMDQLVAMSTVDGAIVVEADTGLVPQVATLVYGVAVAAYDPARGARHNSAIRYTSHHKDVLILTVSEDGPYSIFAGGHQVSAPHRTEHPCAAQEGMVPFPTLERYAQDLVTPLPPDYWA